jgi:putative aldouronate transport system substrate-binding protein
MGMTMKLFAAVFISMIGLLAPIFVSADVNQGNEEETVLGLSIHLHFRNQFSWDSSWPVAKEIERLTNVRLDSVVGNQKADSRELFNRVMLSNDLPDIVGGNGLKEDFNKFGMQGSLIPLNSLIEQYAPNIQRVLNQKPLVRSAITAPDGNIYFIPYIPSGIAGRGYYIRQDWLDNLGLATPTTVDELRTVLIAFRDEDPNQNGKRDEIPYFNRHPEEVIRLVNFFGARSTGSDKYHDFIVDNSSVSHPYVKNEFRNGIAEVAKWFADGLIDPDIFIRGSSARNELLGSDVGGMTHDWFASTAGYNDKLTDTIPDFKFYPFLPPADINGQIMEEHGRALVKPDGWAITSANNHAIETIKYFDFYFSELGRIISNFGVKGKTFDIFMAEPRFKKSVLNNDKSVLSQMMEIGAQIPIGFYQDYNYERQWTNPIAMHGIDAYAGREIIQQPFPGLTLSVDEKEIYDRYWPAIEDYMVEEIKNWITGESNVNADWPTYIQTLQDMGIDLVLEQMNSAYQRQYEAR